MLDTIDTLEGIEERLQAIRDKRDDPVAAQKLEYRLYYDFIVYVGHFAKIRDDIGEKAELVRTAMRIEFERPLI